MVEVWLPYGKTEVPVRIHDENLLGLIDAVEIRVSNPQEVILGAINSPIGSKKLDETIKLGDKVAIVVNDPLFPSNLALPILIDKLSNRGIRGSDITIIFGHNTQDPTEKANRPVAILEELAKKVKIEVSTVDDDDFKLIGRTNRGTKVHIKKAFLEADLRILTGRIGFHPYAGYTGGRDGVLPAICGTETIRRSYTFILDQRAKIGNLRGNLYHQEMEEIAEMAKVDSIINVVLNLKGEVVNAFAGDLDKAFQEGVKFINEKFKVTTETKADIVIVSSGGYPWDWNLYQACGGLNSALNIVKNNGVIIWVAECPTGYGSDVFYDWMSRFKTVEKAAREIRRRYMTGGDAAYLLLKALNRTKIILVSVVPDYYATGIFRLRTARTVNSALNSAFRILGKKSKILVLPHGNSVFPTVKKK